MKFFLNGKGDKWFLRNLSNLEQNFNSGEYLVVTVIKTIKTTTADANQKLLEVGFGGGFRLNWIKNNLAIDACGIDPSLQR